MWARISLQLQRLTFPAHFVDESAVMGLLWHQEDFLLMHLRYPDSMNIFENVIFMFCRNVWKHLENVKTCLKTFKKRLPKHHKYVIKSVLKTFSKTFWIHYRKHFENVNKNVSKTFQKRFKNVSKTFWERFQNVLKTL